ncbi:MAG: hypothetical protein A07HR60_00637 [uncultured archaeon A07HR60]|jgi:hypothetical protein|nr:MAG: hypothetical protein J07HR59_01256 [Halorubrum sp. J07HR59]ESS12535.1 MAG: hypothetical protein A07HR60_00637 [uncultured archaeon A07HR60]
MSKARTVTAQTRHGDVQYEVVLCANCGSEVMPDDAVHVGVGREKYACDGMPFCRATHEQPSHDHALCGYCAQQLFGYSDEPGGVTAQLDQFATESSAVEVGVWLGIVAAVGIVVLVTLLRLFAIV